jgi:hypothetical protein
MKASSVAMEALYGAIPVTWCQVFFAGWKKDACPPHFNEQSDYQGARKVTFSAALCLRTQRIEVAMSVSLHHSGSGPDLLAFCANSLAGPREYSFGVVHCDRWSAAPTNLCSQPIIDKIHLDNYWYCLQ